MANIVCSPNAVVAFNYFIGKGLRDYQAAAIVGNLQQESGISPRLEAMDVNGLMSRGIAMWQPPRWNRLLSFAASAEQDPWALNTQLDFVWEELPSNGLDAILAAPTLEEAVVAFQDRFERPRRDLARTDARISYARSALLSCPRFNPPNKPQSSTIRTIAAAIAGGAIAALTGFGIYKAREAAREREPERPLPEPPKPPRPARPPRPPRPAPARPRPPTLTRPFKPPT